MCGRFALDIDKSVLSQRYHLPQMEIELVPNRNIAPGSFIPVIYQEKNINVRQMRWGLVPHWNREPKTKFATFNARAENLLTSPAFREPFAKKRCLVPASGYYEWKKLEDGTKKPYYFHLKNQSLFSFAGLYDIWKDVEGIELWTCSIITTEPNNIASTIHNRMPVILNESDEILWLESHEVNVLTGFLKSYQNSDLEVEKVKNDKFNQNQSKLF
jgi:putative SOS response-associated peptidase YedK